MELIWNSDLIRSLWNRMKVLHFPGDNKLKDWHQVFTKLCSVLVEKPCSFPTFRVQCAHADTHVRKRRKEAEGPRMFHALVNERTPLDADHGKGQKKHRKKTTSCASGIKF